LIETNVDLPVRHRNRHRKQAKAAAVSKRFPSHKKLIELKDLGTVECAMITTIIGNFCENEA
jgi:hypothetical protein